MIFRDSFEIIFSENAIVAYFGFLNCPPILFPAVSFSFYPWGALFLFTLLVHILVLPSCLSNLGGRRGGGSLLLPRKHQMCSIFFCEHPTNLFSGVAHQILCNLVLMSF